MTNTLFCAGYGYTAAHFAASIAEEWRVIGTTRSAEKADAMRAHGAEALLWDVDATPALPEAAHAILISTPPDGEGCPALKTFADQIAEQSETVRWIGYLSTNGVYGNHDGAWVDEGSDLRPSSDRARRRVAAEARWVEF
ncbi:MAG: SDR family NAD(P)-dependent oxidoreductase, partial [Planctomycetota bacterium]